MNIRSGPSFAIWLALCVAPTTAFWTSSSAPRTSSSSLFMTPPSFILGPMLKKMREDQDKKKVPLYNLDEKAKEAPGLRIGANIWKWPSFWPYDDMIFKASGEAEAMDKQKAMSGFTTMMSGTPQVPTVPDDAAIEATKFNSLDFWGSVEESTSVLDKEGTEKLRSHFDFYLSDGMSVLELGAGANSYLPDNLKLSRHVGVGASASDMEKNPSLTEQLVVDLNDVVEGRDVDSDEIRLLAKEPFDAIITTCTVDFLTGPREVFRSAWYLLKPGGSMIVAFAGTAGAKDKFPDAQTRIWKQYNDDQHMWITGSFFQFSAGDGWENLRGFDISPEEAGDIDANVVQKALNRDKPNNMFVVQATKGFQDDSVDPENLERSLSSLSWMLPSMEDRDKKLVVPRLVRAIETSTNKEEMISAIEANLEHLPAIFAVLENMDKFAFTFTMQSQLAADLICDPDFEANEAQMTSLREGLGLRTPQETFWKPVGMDTAAMDIEDKISLLAYVVPRFGSDDPAQEDALQAFVTGLKPTYESLRSKCPTWTNAEVQLVGTELLAAEVLKPDCSNREQYAKWLDSLTVAELESLLDTRKTLKEAALNDMVNYQEAREAEKERIAALRKKMEEQIQTARETRSMIFNPRTEKFEIFDNPAAKEKNKKN